MEKKSLHACTILTLLIGGVVSTTFVVSCAGHRTSMVPPRYRAIDLGTLARHPNVSRPHGTNHLGLVAGTSLAYAVRFTNGVIDNQTAGLPGAEN